MAIAALLIPERTGKQSVSKTTDTGWVLLTGIGERPARKTPHERKKPCCSERLAMNIARTRHGRGG